MGWEFSAHGLRVRGYGTLLRFCSGLEFSQLNVPGILVWLDSARLAVSWIQNPVTRNHDENLQCSKVEV